MAAVISVYHGSDTEINGINLSKCQANRDFGKGFYVTKFRKQAEEWAEIKGKGKGVVTEFAFYERAFEDSRYKTLRFNDYNEEWLNFIILNRDRITTEQRHDYDIVEGPIADDKISRRVNDFIAGLVSKQQFFKELKHNKENHQICFCTLNSLQMLEKKEKDIKFSPLITNISEPVIEYIVQSFETNEEQATDLFYSSKTFGKLSDESTKLYTKPWQDIYKMLQEELNKEKLE